MSKKSRQGELVASHGAAERPCHRPQPPWAAGLNIPHSPLPIPHSQRHGFTLLELMLVLFVLVTALAMAWPLLSRSLDHARLTSAAEKIQAAWGKARVQAISTGLPHVFRFEADAGEYSIVPWQDENAMLEISMNPGYGTTGASTATTSYSGAATTIGPKLPEGMIFVGVERSSDTRTLASDTNLTATGIAATSPPIVFYPDGTSTEARVTIANQKGRYVSVALRGITGVTRVGEVTTEPGVIP